MKREALLVAALSVLVGALYVYPDLRFVYGLGQDYAGIHLMGAPDETTYLARVRGVYKGDYRLANVGIYEHRSDPYLLPPVPEVIEGSLGKALGLTISQVDMLFTFLMPAVLFVLVFRLAYMLSNHFRRSVVAALALLLGYHVVTPSLGVLTRVFTEGLPLFLVRPITPQFHFIPFVAALLLVYGALEGPTRGTILAAGVAVGALFYFNVLYYWSFVFAGLGVLFVIAVLQGRRDIVRTVLVVLGIALVVSVPYWLEAMAAKSSRGFADMLERHGFSSSRRPIVPFSQVLLAALALVCFRPKRTSSYWFVVAFVLGGFVCLNQQVVTGRSIQAFHWQSYTNKAFLVVTSVLAVASVIRVRSAVVARGAFVGAIVVLLAVAAIQQQNYYARKEGEHAALQPLTRPFQWLVTNTSKDEVVLADPVKHVIPEYISVYTDNYVFLSNTALFVSLASREEVEERYLAALELFGYSLDEATDFFRKMGGAASGPTLYGLWGSAKQIEEHLARLREKYAVLLGRGGTPLNKYKIDYVLVSADRSERLADGQKKGYLRTVYDDGRFKIFKYGTPGSG